MLAVETYILAQATSSLVTYSVQADLSKAMSQVLQDIVRNLALQVINLTTQVAAIAAQHPPILNATITTPPCSKNYVQKPAPYNGKWADNACQVLSAFVIWVQAEKEELSIAT